MHGYYATGGRSKWPSLYPPVELQDQEVVRSRWVHQHYWKALLLALQHLASGSEAKRIGDVVKLQPSNRARSIHNGERHPPPRLEQRGGVGTRCEGKSRRQQPEYSCVLASWDHSLSKA